MTKTTNAVNAPLNEISEGVAKLIAQQFGLELEIEGGYAYFTKTTERKQSMSRAVKDKFTELEGRVEGGSIVLSRIEDATATSIEELEARVKLLESKLNLFALPGVDFDRTQ